VNLDAFGGKIRTRVSSDDKNGRRTWDIVGNGSAISLSRLSGARRGERR